MQNITEGQSPDTLRSEDDAYMLVEKCLPEYDILHLRYWNDSQSLPWKLWTIVEDSAVSRSWTVNHLLLITHDSIES